MGMGVLQYLALRIPTIMEHNVSAQIPEINAYLGNTMMGLDVFISLDLAPKKHLGMELIVFLMQSAP